MFRARVVPAAWPLLIVFRDVAEPIAPEALADLKIRVVRFNVEDLRAP